MKNLFKGRLNRKGFIIAHLIIFAVIGLYVYLLTKEASLLILAILIIPIAFILSLSACIRRLHDMNLYGGYYLWNLIPYISTIFFLILASVKGTVGPNRYGEQPESGLNLY